jgi:putative phosphoribosyl transferase
MKFTNRQEAGRQLASRLTKYRNVANTLVLGLPRGGVPVAYAVAEELNAPLDTFIVRKVGVPGHQELAMGAVASGGVAVSNRGVIRGLQVPQNVFDGMAEQERREIERREELYRGHRPGLVIEGRTTILVDDGLATGASMRAAVAAVRQQRPRRLVVAVPVAARATAEQFRQLVDHFVSVLEPDELDGVGRWYDDFRQTTDQEVRQLLDARARASEPR